MATASVNLRTGPGTRYAINDVVPAGAPVRVNACLNNRNWCDVTFEDARGWVSSRYLEAADDYSPGVAPLAFGFFLGGPIWYGGWGGYRPGIRPPRYRPPRFRRPGPRIRR